jgi:dihydroorotase
VFPLGALTKGLAGESLTEMAELTESGCVGFGQAEIPLANTQVMQRAMQYAATFGYTVWLRPQELYLGKGVAASGALATRLGLSGVPVAAETIALHTIFELIRATGASVHLCRISSAAGVVLLRTAKAEGLQVTADVSINSLHLTDNDIGYFDSRARLTPVLRQQRDRDALQAGLFDGTIDALVSDHNPVEADAKNLPFGEAEPGATGLELLLSLALKWGQQHNMSLIDTLSRITLKPSQVLESSLGTMASSIGRLNVGGAADLCIFDPAQEWSVSHETLRSQGKHTPFAHDMGGSMMPARVKYTLVNGQLAFERN